MFGENITETYFAPKWIHTVAWTLWFYKFFGSIFSFSRSKIMGEVRPLSKTSTSVINIARLLLILNNASIIIVMLLKWLLVDNLIGNTKIRVNGQIINLSFTFTMVLFFIALKALSLYFLDKLKVYEFCKWGWSNNPTLTYGREFSNSCHSSLMVYIWKVSL